MIKILRKVKMIHEQNKNVNKEVGHIKKNQQLKFVGLKNTIIHLKIYSNRSSGVIQSEELKGKHEKMWRKHKGLMGHQ